MRHSLTAMLIAAAMFAAPALAAWETPNTPVQNLGDNAPNSTPGMTTTVRDPYFKITTADVGKAVAEQLQLQAVETKAEATLNPGIPPVLYSADHAIQVVIHSLQIDTQAKKWQAQAYIIGNGQTETVKPVSGIYSALIDVPTLKRGMRQHDVIQPADLTTLTVSERQVRKDTITDAKSLVGQSPRSIISAGRAIRLSEVTQPVVIKRGDAVEMTYTTQYMHIKTTGIALEDGAKGNLIRVKNEKSEKAVSGRVEDAGHVEVNSAQTM